jgi:NTE family protein
VLEREGLHVDLIVGSSIGAIIGAMAVQSGSAAELEERARSFLGSEFFLSLELQHFIRHSAQDDVTVLLEDWTGVLKHHLRLGKSLLHTGALAHDILLDGLAMLFENVDLSATRPRLACVSTGLSAAAPVIHDTGPLLPAVAASCTIPGVFESVPDNGEMYVDGGVTSPVPVTEARALGAERIIAVDVRRARRLQKLPESGPEVLLQVGDVAMRHCGTLALREADVVVQPAVGDVHWADFAHIDSIIEHGKTAAERALPEIARAFA